MAGSVIVVGAGISGLCTAAMLAREGVRVRVLEKSRRVGGRTASSTFRGHTLDNGFHIMPFYKASAVYGVLRRLGITGRLPLAMVDRISFFKGSGFFRYPRGIMDMLRLSMVPPAGRLRLLRLLLPMAFSPMAWAERHDSRALSEVTAGLRGEERSFFEAVCMLAFADTPEHVSLGEFVRTMIRANPFRGGTSGFAYPAEGGYDRVCELLAQYVRESGGTVELGAAVSGVTVSGGATRGVVDASGRPLEADAVVVSYPAYRAVGELFGDGVLGDGVAGHARRLERTTSVVETHFCTSERVDSRQVVFPVGDYTAKGVFFVSNIAPSVSPEGEHLLMAGTPVSAADAENPARVREISRAMRDEIAGIYPGFEGSLLWERPMAWSLVESVAKEPGMVWKQKMPHSVPGVAGLYFVGDSTVSYGIGTDSAAHSSVLCHPKIMGHLRAMPGAPGSLN